MLFFKKKIKFDKSFIKQEFSKLILKENLEVFESLRDAGEIVDEKGLSNIRKQISKDLFNDLKGKNKQEKRFRIYAFLLEKLHKKQNKRRIKYLSWFNRYLNKLEAKQERKLLTKHCYDLDRKSLLDYEKYDFISTEELFYTDDFSSVIYDPNASSEDFDNSSEEVIQTTLEKESEKPSEEKSINDILLGDSNTFDVKKDVSNPESDSPINESADSPIDSQDVLNDFFSGQE